ncbi:MAG: hypothetical protein DI603_06580 [Roseateles depolymerans]|uniref:HTH tetR-type domain-containing protein n=1 Tax=Roseateles depolymerans TaxID=76731 RepID=A0A2W5DRZ8_9BURK|nr:MAG: hypothetical protein DI603_06580 [Roseateles depolymerans]
MSSREVVGKAAAGTRTARGPAGLASRTRVRRGPTEMARLKQDLLARARHIYAGEGPEALSMRRLAQDLGLSTMALYSYFPSKHALLEALWLEVFEALRAELTDAAKGLRAPLKVMEAHLRGYLGFWEARPEQFRMIYMSTPHTAEGDAVPMKDLPVYAELLRLEGQRVAACSGRGQPPGADLLAEVSALALTKLIGYLLLVLGIPRYPLPDRDALRERVVADALSGIAEGLGG